MNSTIKDIAKLAEVSYSTVSRCLNDSTLVSPKTREKVKGIAKSIGFEFNANARGLSTSKTGTVGIIYPESFERFEINMFFAPMQNYLKRGFEKEKLDTIITFRTNRFTKESDIIKLVTKNKVDGMVIIYSFIGSDELKCLEMNRVPFVFLHNRPEKEIENSVNAFYTDHFKGGYKGVDYLVKMGHKNLLIISPESEEFKIRLNGMKQALYNNGLKIDDLMVINGHYTYESGYTSVREYLIPGKTTAVFAQTDLMALGAIQALKDMGLKVPQDVSVLGYDDIEPGRFIPPALTTIRQPREELAQLACNRLVELMKNYDDAAEHEVLEPELIIRESCSFRKEGD